MITPKAVVFDLGKVLVDFDYAIAACKIASRAKLTLGELAHFINHSPLFSRYETGLLTSEEFYQAICAATGFHGTFEQFSSYFADIFTAIPPMVQLHGALCQKAIPTYAFSNTNDLAVRHIRHRFPFLREVCWLHSVLRAPGNEAGPQALRSCRAPVWPQRR